MNDKKRYEISEPIFNAPDLSDNIVNSDNSFSQFASVVTTGNPWIDNPTNIDNEVTNHPMFGVRSRGVLYCKDIKCIGVGCNNRACPNPDCPNYYDPTPIPLPKRSRCVRFTQWMNNNGF